MLKAKVWVLCSHCGDAHRLTEGDRSPLYTCPSLMLDFELEEGDEVWIEDQEKECARSSG